MKPLQRNTYSSIGNYAAIGDCRCLGLISISGSLDWLCLPRFDSPSFFGAILDAGKGGCFAIRPVEPFRSRRQYVENTNVLQTYFTTEKGKVCLTDMMPVESGKVFHRELLPERYIIRKVECLEGEVELEVIYEPRPQYGGQPVQLTDRKGLGISYQHQGNLLVLSSDFPLRLRNKATGAYGLVTLARGEDRYFNLSFTAQKVAVIPPLDRGYLEKKFRNTVSWWGKWADGCTYEGMYRKEVLRSILTLKLLVYAPSGAVIAAPSTSLPENIGGTRNWDYRYCWLRDAAMTLRAFIYLGYHEEAESFLSWLLYTTKLSRPRLKVLYSVYGEIHMKESKLDFLEGYRSSRPVRIGNAAGTQLQLDIYGEVIQGAYEIARIKQSFDRATTKMLLGLGKLVCRQWRQPDKGIWEIRSDLRHNTHSKVMCWVALDRLIALHERGFIKVPINRFTREREAIRAEIEEKGYSHELQSYISYYGSGDVDISLLMLPIYQYIRADDKRMVSTYARIWEKLSVNGLLYRFPFGFDGISEQEGAFAIAMFLAAKVLAERGALGEARETFEQALAYANDVGLYGEEIDPDSGDVLGNFPQAYTHVGLINAAVAITANMQSRKVQDK